MKSTGVIRKVDSLGRIVIPRELRGTLEIDKGEPLEIFVENEKIILRKYSNQLACVVTGEITKENRQYGKDNIVLSPKGCEILLKELQQHYHQT